MVYRLLCIALSSLWLQAASAEGAKLSLSRFIRTADGAKIEVILDKAIDTKAKINTNLVNQTVEVDLAGVLVDIDKESKAIEDEKINHLYIYQPKAGLLRSRIIYKKPIAASEFAGRVETQVDGNKLTIQIYDTGSAVVESTEARPPVALEDETQAAPAVATDDKQLAAAAETINQDMSASATTATTVIAKKAENEIPVLTQTQVKAAGTNPSLTRLAISFAVVAVMGGILAWAARRWAKAKNPIGSQAKIKVLTQHSLGAKKSLAIISVAGESILIGVTDHNISMIKALSLLDEEIPEQVPQDFKVSMKEEEQRTRDEEDFADENFAFGNVKDTVRSRLKQMRRL